MRAETSGNTDCRSRRVPSDVSRMVTFNHLSHSVGSSLRPRQPLISSLENLTCPPAYLLFNRLCYFVHSSFVSGLRSGEHLCSSQYINSTLVKFSSHEWSNINGTRFFGRTRYDTLLEVFYYQLEPKLLTQTSNATRTKHWLRLLLGDKHDPDECVLRYFTRASGAFTTLHRCFHGGHPVCQSDPILKKIVVIPPARETSRSPEITRGILTDSSTVPSSSSSSSTPPTFSTTTAITLPITLPITLTPNDSLILSNETSLAMCDNCTTNLLADEDLSNNETSMEEQTFLNITLANGTLLAHSSSENYRSLLMIISGPLFALILLLIGVVFLVRYVRRIHGSYSPGQTTLLPSHRRKRRSTTSPTASDVSNAPAVLYTRLQSTSSSINADPDLLHPSGHSMSNEDHIQLLPRIVIDKCLPEDPIIEDEEEPFYATVRDSYEK